MPQSGVECIGDLDDFDVYEILRLADDCLRLLPCETALSFSHLGILRSLLNLLPADENDRAEILRLLSSRSIHGLSELFRRRGFDTAVFDTLLALLGLECSLSELPNRLRSLAGDRLEESVLQELDELAALAEGDDCRARFDISVLNDPHYYNGLVFRGYARGAADKVLSGGRYDRLVRRMGRSGGAVGFAVYLALVPSAATEAGSPEADVMVLYDERTSLTELRRRCEALRASGKRVSTQCRPDDSLHVSEILDLREGGDGHA